MIRLIPFKPFHALEIFPQMYLPLDFMSKEHLDYMELHCMAYTAVIPVGLCDEYLGFAGCIPMWQGVAELYSFLPNRIKKNHRLFLHRSSKEFLNKMQKKLNLHRMQFTVELGDYVGYKWAKSLGFVDEGIMPMYTPDKKSFTRFGKIWQ